MHCCNFVLKLVIVLANSITMSNIRKTIQNELICVCGEYIREQILREIRAASLPLLPMKLQIYLIQSSCQL